MKLSLNSETGRVCREAALVYRRLWQEALASPANGNVIVVAAAGKPPRDNVVMSELMAERLKTLGAAAFALKAKAWNTEGEVVCLRDHLQKAAAEERTQLIVVARWWHLPRAMLFVRHHFKGLESRFDIAGHPVRTWHDPKGMVRELFGAWPVNLWRIYKRKRLRE